MRKYEAVLFDLDGTLLDTLEDLRDAVNHIMKKYDFPEHSLEEIRKAVGDGIRKLIERCVPAGTDTETIDAAFADFKVYYGANCQNKTKPYDGITALAKRLKEDGYKLAVVSNKNHEAVQKLIPFYFGDLFEISVGAMEDKRKKPAPDTSFYALEKLGVSKEQALFVGDSQVDVETAKNAEIPGILVTWGFRSREELMQAGATVFADDTTQLYETIQQMG